MIKRIRFIYFTSIAITLFMVLTLTFDLFKINQLNKMQQHDSKLSFVWFLTQAERESREFYQNVILYHSGNGSISKQDVLTSFDIYWSRYDPEINKHMQKLALSIKLGKEFFEHSRAVLLILDPLVQELSPKSNQAFEDINKISKYKNRQK